MVTHTFRHRAMFLIMAFSILGAGATAHAGQTGSPGLFSRAKMQEVDLKGLRVWLGEPVQVTEVLGWNQSGPVYEKYDARGKSPKAPGGSAWAAIHLTPYMARFPKGNLIITYALDPDWYANPVSVSGFQISRDAGEHWGRRYSLIMQHMTMTFLPKAPDSLLCLPSEFFQPTPEDPHTYHGVAYRFEQGGERMVVVPDGVRVVDLPWQAHVWPSPQPRDDWRTGVRISGSAVEMGHRILATGSLMKEGDKNWTAVLWASEDGGYTWRYLSTISSPDLSLASQKGYDGPCEINMIQLANGDLMAVFRVGGGQNWPLQRAYSHDAGHTWTTPDVLPAWSVSPELKRLENGTIALSTGRPGIHLWFSPDPQATTWQNIDIVAHHNRWATDPSMRILSSEETGHRSWQTTSYTGLVEVAPNRLPWSDDRDPEQAPADADDLSRVYVLPIEVGRD